MADERLVDGYARALLEVLQAEGQLDSVERELFQVSKQLDANHELKQALADQSVPVDRREKALSDVLGKKVSPHTLGALGFVVGQGRARLLGPVIDRLSALAAESKRAVVGEVRAAVPLDDEQQRRLAEALSKATGKQVEVRVIVDPSVIGGVVAKVGDTVIDGSIRRRLEELKEGVRS